MGLSGGWVKGNILRFSGNQVYQTGDLGLIYMFLDPCFLNIPPRPINIVRIKKMKNAKKKKKKK